MSKKTKNFDTFLPYVEKNEKFRHVLKEDDNARR